MVGILDEKCDGSGDGAVRGMSSLQFTDGKTNYD
jgi:hypothetical protein